jgi:hypothetical protein
MLAAGLVSWLVTWWAGPPDRAGLDQFGSFDSRGIVPAGYAAFAFTLGVLAGALLRRTVPAMAATLAVFTAARLAFRLLARPRLLPPVTLALPLDPATTGYGAAGFLPLMPASSLQPAAPDLPNARVTSIGLVSGKGKGLTAGELASTCPGLAVTYHEAVTYQPASRYRPLQWYELCVFLGAALLLAGLCAWRVHRTG